jgi:hypothetical protein
MLNVRVPYLRQPRWFPKLPRNCGSNLRTKRDDINFLVEHVMLIRNMTKTWYFELSVTSMSKVHRVHTTVMLRMPTSHWRCTNAAQFSEAFMEKRERACEQTKLKAAAQGWDGIAVDAAAGDSDVRFSHLLSPQQEAEIAASTSCLVTAGAPTSKIRCKRVVSWTRWDAAKERGESFEEAE